VAKGIKTSGQRRNTDGLGPRLRAARESRNIGVRELARRIGVSPSLISQIETGKSDPSVNTLTAIANELELPANEIVFGAKETGRAPVAETPAAAGAHSASRQVRTRVRRADAAAATVFQPVQREADRRTIHLDSGVVWQSLSAMPDHDVDFLYVQYPPGAASTPSKSLMRHNGREYGYVLSGKLSITIGFEEYELGQGDSISFDSTEPHRLAAVGDDTVEAVWFVLGRRHFSGEAQPPEHPS
jgi:transcriptional regulator with XRE-family HTH domain